MTREKLTAWAACFALGLVVGCTPEGEQGDSTTEEVGQGTDGKTDGVGQDGTTEKPLVCVGIRGNGQNIFAHFGGLARIHEEYGQLTAVAGGSSGSITTFLTESMYTNPAVYQCGGDASCSDAQVGERMSLMYKSLEGYAGVIAQTDEVAAFQMLIPVAKKLKAEGVGTLVEDGKYEEARDAMLKIFASDDLKMLINPEVVALLTNSANPEFHVMDIWQSVTSFGSFKVESADVLLRPGVLSFGGVTELVGRIGNFYAGYGAEEKEPKAWGAFLDTCAEPARGKAWAEVMQLDGANGQTCGEMFFGMLTEWRADYIANASEKGYSNMLDTKVGTNMPALVTTSVITGDAIPAWKSAREQYTTAKPIEFAVNFDDVKLGYWGFAGDLEEVQSNAMGYSDLKTQKFMSLGEATYREVLALSPAEPGLARALEINEQVVSTGGWSDLEPSLVLKNMGCEQVILLTRQGDTVGFGADVASQLGMTQAQEDVLFAPGKESSVKLSLQEADGVWCTNWDAQDSLNFAQIIGDAYNAPMEVHSSWLAEADGAYENISTNLNLVGCTPGVGE